MVFWLGDPLRELYPECYAEASHLAEEAARAGLRIVNPPDALSRSIKSVQSGLWRRAGLPTPEHYRFTSRRELEAIARDVAFPVIVRSDALHAQESVHLCRDMEKLRQVPEHHLRLPGTLVSFVDIRAEFRTGGNGGPFAEFYHYKRVAVVGDTVRPLHVYFSEQPIVAKRTSTLLDYKKLRHRGPVGLQRARHRYQDCIDADTSYFPQGDGHAELMRRAAATLGLDFVAIDYATRPDGTPVLWEANPYFRLTPWYRGLLPVRRRLWRRTRSLYEDVARLFRDLLA